VSSSTENDVAGVSGWRPAGSPIARSTLPTGATAPVPGPVRPPTAARERKPALAALALLLIAVGVLASVYLQMQAGNRIGVIELTQRVPQGQQISDSDITELMVAKDSSINYVTWSERGLLGKYTAQTTLVAGTILIGPMLTTTPTVNGNVATIAVKLSAGQYPPVTLGAAVNAYYVGSAQNVPPGYASSAAGSTTSGSGSPSTSSGGAGSNGNDVSVLLSNSVTVMQLPGGASFLSGSSSADTQVFTVSVPKTAVGALLGASAEGDLVFTSGAGS
jgi:hypothetical protein